LRSVEHCRSLGVKVGLATDVAGGYSPSMLSAIRNAVITNKVLKMPMAVGLDSCRSLHGEHGFDYRHAFWLATAGSAEALSMQVSQRVVHATIASV
jgi:guanine deaminase